MQMLGMLMPLLSLITFAAFVWLVVVAFRCSTMWGVLVLLFSPITAIIFAIKYWDEAKKPFFTYIGSGAAIFAVMLMMIFYIGSPMLQMAAELQDGEIEDAQALGLMEETMDRMENSGMLDAEDQAELSDMRGMLDEMEQDLQADEETTADPVAIAASAPPSADEQEPKVVMPTESDSSSDPPTLTSVTGRTTRDFVPLHQLTSHVGEKLRVVTRDGNEFQGHFIEESGGDLQFERRLPAGTFAVYLPKSSVRSVHPIKRR